MRKIITLLAFIGLVGSAPQMSSAESTMHYTNLWHVTEQEWPTLNNPLVLRTYARSSHGYFVPNGYRIIEPLGNECIVAIPEELIQLVAQVWEGAEPRRNYSGQNVYVKLKTAGVTEYTITRQREIVNRFHEVRTLLKADYDFLTDHFMSIAEVTTCP